MRQYRNGIFSGALFEGKQCVHCIRQLRPTDRVFLYPVADLPAHQGCVSTVNWQDVDQHLAALVAANRTDLLFTINRAW